MNFWKKIQEIRKRFKELENERGFVELNENGFALMRDRWPFLKPVCQRNVLWEDIFKIDVAMWDCWSCHTVGLYFYDVEGKYMAHIHEDLKGYDNFVEHVKGRFAGFNINNFEAIELIFPSDIWFPCWDREKKVSDLVVDRDEQTIIWKDTQESFLEWEDEEKINKNCGIRDFFRRIFYGKSTCI
ncbi:MAG: hypothetical protein ABFR90_05730 [Planctomycetota bacterium]